MTDVGPFLEACPEGAAVKFGTALLIEDGSGRILFEHRNDWRVWGLIGGRLDPGESVLDCAKREAREETGFDVEITHFLGLYSHPADRIVVYPDNGDVRHLVDAAFVARIVSGSLVASPESLELDFFQPQTPPEPLAPPALRILADYVDWVAAGRPLATMVK